MKLKFIKMKKERKISFLFLFLCFLLFFIAVFLFYNFYNFYKFHFLDYSSIYQENILQMNNFEKIKEICSKYDETNMVLDPKANGRLMHVFPIYDSIYSLIFQPNFIQKIKNICGNQRLIPCLKIPIEYRKYTIGSNMDWHRDVQMLPDQLQYECVITLENTSDSKTILKDWFGLLTRNISSAPNSLVVVKAKGVEHCVTTTNSGTRTILKFVFCEP